MDRRFGDMGTTSLHPYTGAKMSAEARARIGVAQRKRLALLHNPGRLKAGGAFRG
jgi:hypothetical protein